MTVLNNADALHVGSDMAAAAYLGSETVWPPGPLPHIIDVVDGITSVTLPIPSAALPTSVDWGDGSTTLERTHTYSSPTSGVTIAARFDWFNDAYVALTWIADVKQFGFNSQTGKDNQIASGLGAFHRVPVAGLTALPALDTSNVTSMKHMFENATNFNQPIGNWDVSNVTDMDWMFYKTSSFDQPIGDWDVSNVTNMYAMLQYSAFNQPIRNWNVSNVTDMRGMFRKAPNFNLPIGDWDVSNVTDMLAMFEEAPFFNQNLSGWCVINMPSKPTNFDNGATSWTLPRPVWGTCPRGESITFPAGYSMEDAHIFVANDKPVNLPVESDTSVILVAVNGVNKNYVTEVKGKVFNNSTIHAIFDWNNTGGVNQGWFSDILQFGSRSTGGEPAGYTNPPALASGRIPNQLKSAARAFRYMAANPAAISNLDVSNATEMNSMFSDSSFNRDISGWDVSNVDHMGSMFYLSSFNQPIGNWNVSNVTQMRSMFDGASNFNQNLSQWCVSQIPAEPREFDFDATSWTLPRPVWGTCPPR